ncbi:MAG: hypothetical protein QOH87_4228 [Trebonia sp.]|nr:hypothetical protein [Trebonia sp.]
MTATVTGDVQEQVLGIVRKSQEMTLNAIKQVVETGHTVAGKLPPMPFADKLPSSLPQLPGVRALPTPEAVVSATFDFFDRLLAGQRKFAGELIKATAPLRPAARPESGPATESGPAPE